MANPIPNYDTSNAHILSYLVGVRFSKARDLEFRLHSSLPNITSACGNQRARDVKEVCSVNHAQWWLITHNLLGGFRLTFSRSSSPIANPIQTQSEAHILSYLVGGVPTTL